MIVNNKSIYATKNLDHAYYNRQLKKPYESTIKFFEFLDKKINLKKKKVLDLACGNGANLIYLNKNFGVGNCCGVDQNSFLLNQARTISKVMNLNKIFFKKANILNLKNKKFFKKNKFDGAICIQTLSVLDDYKEVILSAKRLNLKFICVNSLFWQGDIDFKISVNFLAKKNRNLIKVNHYNIYSIKHYLSFLKKKGFKKNYICKFNNTENIKTKNQQLMGSHTVTLNGKKVTKSGPLILDWFFVLSIKK